MNEPCYHCGPFWFPQWLKKLLSKKFNSACGLHDDLYRDQTITRFQADISLLYFMLWQVNGVKDFALAWLFFVSVRLFGWISWRRNAQQLRHSENR